MAVMEGESAVQAVHGSSLEQVRQSGFPPSEELQQAMDAMRADFEHQLDAQYAGARGYLDAIVYPEDTRTVLGIALRAAWQNPGPHLGPFVLPSRLGGEP
jgi:acetyl-CoA carboxylase carboxyltransferase component